LIFDYPTTRTERRHGPVYNSYGRYRPWLRDEFDFRCVYCLKRERWGQVTGEFDIDHFEPQAINPAARAAYSNLLYACHRCNLVKSDQVVADPFSLLESKQVAVLPDGVLVARGDEANRLILQLDLNSPKMREWRILWMRIVDLARVYDAGLFQKLITLSDAPPDLNRLKPSANSRLDGINQSWFAKKSRGEDCALS
jgi:5-methylcytosine-specific restriction endonuclease McrA